MPANQTGAAPPYFLSRGAIASVVQPGVAALSVLVLILALLGVDTACAQMQGPIGAINLCGGCRSQAARRCDADCAVPCPSPCSWPCPVFLRAGIACKGQVQVVPSQPTRRDLGGLSGNLQMPKASGG